jgi:hypothetical protein
MYNTLLVLVYAAATAKECKPEKGTDLITSSTHKVDTNSRDVALCVGVICKSQQQTGLSHATVTDQQ